LLNEALATELVCVLRYRRHHFMASGLNAQTVAQEFLQHANEEQAHADQIAKRIVQIGGEPDFSPEGLHTRSHSQYVAGGTLLEMIEEDLIAERVAIDSYREGIAYLADTIRQRGGCSNRSLRWKRTRGGSGKSAERARALIMGKYTLPDLPS
jgi:bacterioferritin